jgi:xylulokinase
MSTLDCGIDIGSTNIKVVLVDGDGRPAWTQAVPTPRRIDGEGAATDALELVALLEEMVAAGWRKVGGNLPLRSVTTTGVGEDGVGIDAAGQPTGLALPWFDGRAATEAAELFAHPAANPRTGIAVAADRTVAKWLWLHRHRAHVLRDAVWWGALTDFPVFRWSGRPFMSRTLAARTGAYDVYRRVWVDELLQAAGAPALPPLLDAGTAVGTFVAGPLRASGAVSGETLLVAGGHDHPVAASAIRRVHPNARVDSMGTANLVYGEASGVEAAMFDPFMAFSVPVSARPGVACLGVMGLSAILRPAEGDAPPLTDILAAPRIPGCPPENADAPSAAALEIRRRLEWATFHTRRMFAAMDAAGAEPGPIYATGGWARSTAFLELRASIFGRRIHAIDEPELAAIGAALFGAQGAGVAAPSLEHVHRIRTIEPVPAWSVAYDELYPSVRRRLEAAQNKHTDQPGSVAAVGARESQWPSSN